MLLTGRRIKAEQAKEWGLVDEVVYADRVLPDAIALAAEIAANAPLAVRSTRKTLRGDLAAAVKAPDRPRILRTAMADENRRLQGRREGRVGAPTG